MVLVVFLCGSGKYFMNQYSITLCRIREFSDEEICVARLYVQNFVLYSERRYNLVRDKLGHEPLEEEMAGDCSLKTRFSLQFRMGMCENYNEFRWLVNKEEVLIFEIFNFQNKPHKK